MSSSKNHKVGYYFFDGIPLFIRGIVLFALILGGLAAQFIYGQTSLGFLFLLIAAFLGAHRSFKEKITINKERDATWETVSIEQWQRANDLTGNQGSMARDITNIGSLRGFVVALVLVVIIISVNSYYHDRDKELSSILVGDFIILFIPVFILGRISTPKIPQPELYTKIDALMNVYEHFSNRQDLKLLPMFQMVPAESESQSGSVPVDARLMIRISGQPETFYGVQVQCSINNASPYVYGVILSAPDFRTNLQPPDAIKEANAIVEQKSTAEARVLVVRQKTTENIGYYTIPEDQIRIVKAAVDLAQKAIEARV